jgi:hypothetical protein
MNQKVFDRPPPETDAPTNVKALNLPDEPDEVDEGTADGETTAKASDRDERAGAGTNDREDEKPEANPCQASSSSRRSVEGGVEEAMMTQRKIICNKNHTTMPERDGNVGKEV